MKDTRVAVVITRAPMGCIQENPERAVHWANVAKQKQPFISNSGYRPPLPAPVNYQHFREKQYK